MGTEKEAGDAVSEESFCPSEEDVHKWMTNAFDMVGYSESRHKHMK